MLIALCLTFIIPYLWMIATSLRTEMAYNSTGFTLLPIDEFGKLSFHFENYGEAFKALDLGTVFLNTMIVCVVNTAANLFLNSLARTRLQGLNSSGATPFSRSVFFL